MYIIAAAKRPENGESCSVKRKINEPSNAYADIRTLLKPKQLVRAVWMSERVCVRRAVRLWADKVFSRIFFPPST